MNDSNKLIDVKGFVNQLRENVKNHTKQLLDDYNLKPGLAVVLVGENPASEVYVNHKIKATTEAGMHSAQYRFDSNTSEKILLNTIEQLNNDPTIDGILVQLPLPDHIDDTKVINAISPAKDVDGFHIQNIGYLGSQQNRLVPCTPLGCSLLLQQELGDLSGKHAVIIGRSRIVGRPMTELLLQQNCTVSVIHSRTPEAVAKQLTKSADIIVAAVGIPHMLKAEDIAPGAVIIDVGINRIWDEAKQKHIIVGDVDTQSALQVADRVTPVPGGIGLLTVSCLLLNTYRATCWLNDVEPKI